MNEKIKDKANKSQFWASDPNKSVWVNANAGSGKTKVLTDRILRLLMAGTPPGKILCLTYTRVGASEMLERVNQKLMTWATLPEEDLRGQLEKLLDMGIEYAHIATARQLFARVLNTPGGLKIQTIHSLCQSILKQFPIESETMIGFSVMDGEQSKDISKTAMAETITHMMDEKSHHMNIINNKLEEDTLRKLCQNMITHGDSLDNTLHHKLFDFGEIIKNIKKKLGILPDFKLSDFPSYLLDPEKTAPAGITKIQDEDLHEILKFLNSIKTQKGEPNKKIRPLACKLENWLNLPMEQRLDSIDDLIYVFLTEGEVRSGYGHFVKEPLFSEIAENIQSYLKVLGAYQTAELTEPLLSFGKQFLDRYTDLKTRRGLLEFKDMELATLRLLERAHLWVMYKWDKGIDHILVDEAQDTSPLQWKIIDNLIKGFFDQKQDSSCPRTIFAVGDFKQSIYSFQGASPQEFIKYSDTYREKVANIGADFVNIPMQTSFRSVRAVLNYVDEVFNGDVACKGVKKDTDIEHPFTRTHGGRVDIWPLVPKSKDIPTPERLLAKELAHWVWESTEGDKKIYLPDKGRYAHAGDFLFLVRQRKNKIFKWLVKELREKKIPILGEDRLQINDHIAVQDILAICKFVLYPNDDLNLACVLKSPFVGMDEDGSDDALFQLCHHREKCQSVWEKLQQHKDDKTHNGMIYGWLKSLLDKADTMPPYEFLQGLLNNPCAVLESPTITGWQALRRRLGADGDDPVADLLQYSLNFERLGVASLQRFVHRMTALNEESKRETGGDRKEVAIMTVHGAKGLQSPIVIIPNAAYTRTGGGGESTDFTYDEGNTPFYIPSGAQCPEYLEKAKEDKKQAKLEEEHRLLYVALTRAEDRLLIAGVASREEKKNQKPYSDGCWYDLCIQGWESMEKKKDSLVELETSEKEQWKGDIHSVIYDGDKQGTDNTTESPSKETTEKNTQESKELPSWVHTLAPCELPQARPLTPSRQDDKDDTPSQSTQSGTDRNPYQRGLMIHKALELLPNLPQDKWEQGLDSYFKAQGDSLADADKQDYKKQVLGVLRHPDLQDLFTSPDTKSELALSGMVGTHPVLAHVDRVLITEKDITVVDYKTGRKIPEAPDQIPPQYVKQMAIYQYLLQQLHPNHAIDSYIVWTDGPVMMPLDKEKMDAHIQSILNP